MSPRFARFELPAFAALFLATAPVCGDVVDESFGDELIGANVTVSFIVETAPNSFIVFSPGDVVTIGPGNREGVASASGDMPWNDEVYQWSYEFSLSGETSTSPWTLTNTSPDDRVYLQSVIFFMFGGAVIDRGTKPSTPGSGPGHQDAVYLSGPVIFDTSWEKLWGDPANAGDLYSTVLVQWAELPNFDVFPAGATATFLLDSDLVTDCPWDIDNSGVVGPEDLIALLGRWGDVGARADFNDPPGVGPEDLIELLGNWGACR